MSGLYESDDRARWDAARERYPVALATRPNRTIELDAFYHDELPETVRGRDPRFVTREELLKLTEWKMKRGEWRARNLVLVRGNSEDDVTARSREAFAAVPDPRKPITRLVELAGVGPATASAVLATVHGDLYPFFDEVIAKQIPGLGEVKFTVAYYLRYAEALRARARDLPGFTADRLGDALWAEGVLARAPA